MNLIRFACLVAVLSVIGLSSAEATHPIALYRFAFDSDESNLNITGGFAGIYEDYSIHGVFELQTGDHGVPARFSSVNAVLDGSSFHDGADLNALINMTGLEADTISPSNMLFEGMISDYEVMTLQVDIENNVLTMSGQSEFCLSCADFFVFRIDAVAHLEACDFNDDIDCNSADIDILRDAVINGIENPRLDIDGRGDPNLPDRFDFDFYITDRSMLGTGFGDADLNRIINFNDFVLLSNSYNKIGAGWADGNFHLDDITNFNDYVVLTGNLGMTWPSDTSTSTPSIVPEAMTSTILIIAFGGLTGMRRRHSSRNGPRCA